MIISWLSFWRYFLSDAYYTTAGFTTVQRLFLILVRLENPSLHSCLECKFLLRGYYVGDRHLCMLFQFITYFIILFVGGQYIMFCEGLCRVSLTPQMFTTFLSMLLVYSISVVQRS